MSSARASGAPSQCSLGSGGAHGHSPALLGERAGRQTLLHPIHETRVFETHLFVDPLTQILRRARLAPCVVHTDDPPVVEVDLYLRTCRGRGEEEEQEREKNVSHGVAPTRSTRASAGSSFRSPVPSETA